MKFLGRIVVTPQRKEKALEIKFFSADNSFNSQTF